MKFTTVDIKSGRSNTANETSSDSISQKNSCRSSELDLVFPIQVDNHVNTIQHNGHE